VKFGPSFDGYADTKTIALFRRPASCSTALVPVLAAAVRHSAVRAERSGVPLWASTTAHPCPEFRQTVP
jgi:hypothetical protein